MLIHIPKPSYVVNWVAEDDLTSDTAFSQAFELAQQQDEDQDLDLIYAALEHQLRMGRDFDFGIIFADRNHHYSVFGPHNLDQYGIYEVGAQNAFQLALTQGLQQTHANLGAEVNLIGGIIRLQRWLRRLSYRPEAGIELGQPYI